MHNFDVVACDTDSVFLKKKDQSSFSEEECLILVKELNSLYPENIKWELNGLYPKKITFKAKNYILYDGSKIKYKGSSLVASTKEKALKEFINSIVDSMIHDRNDYTEIYNRYVKEIFNVQDIKRWVVRKTLTQAVLTSERTNESKVRDAIIGTDYREGDRFYLYFTLDDKLRLVEHFDGEYDKNRLLKKLHDTAKIFGTVLNVKDLFCNYSLRKNQKDLEELLLGNFMGSK